MTRIQLMPFASVPRDLLAELCAGLSQEFNLPCEILPPEPQPVEAFNTTRRQYLSTHILASMINRAAPETWRLLGVTTLDLYIPILTFVFGEAQLKGNCAVVSAHRLQQEFYGLPADPALVRERLLKEAIHELGHTLELPHCEDYQCVMSASHGVEWIDLKGSRFCSKCRPKVHKQTIVRAAI